MTLSTPAGRTRLAKRALLLAMLRAMLRVALQLAMLRALAFLAFPFALALSLALPAAPFAHIVNLHWHGSAAITGWLCGQRARGRRSHVRTLCPRIGQNKLLQLAPRRVTVCVQLSVRLQRF